MFWEFGLSFSSIETLLENEDATLEDFLSDEDLLQEVKTKNLKLIELFLNSDFIPKMLEYVLTEPDSSICEKIRYKFATISSEVLTANVMDFDNILVDKQEHLHQIFDSLRNEDMSILMCNFISKLVVYLIQEYPTTIYGYFVISGYNLVESLLKNIKSNGVSDIFLKIISHDLPLSVSDDFVNLLLQQSFVEKVVEMLSVGKSYEVQASVTNLIVEVVRNYRIKAYFNESVPYRSPIIDKFYSDQVLEVLFENMQLKKEIDKNSFESDKTVRNICTVLQTLFDQIRVGDLYGEELLDYTEKNHSILCDFKTNFDVICKYIPDMVSYIERNTVDSKTLGMTNLMMVKFLCGLTTIDQSNVVNAIINSGFLILLWKLVEKFPFHSIFHQIVCNITNYAISSGFIVSKKQNFFSNINVLKSNESIINHVDSPLLSHTINDVQVMLVIIKMLGNNDRRKFGYRSYLLNLISKLSAVDSKFFLPSSPRADILQKNFEEVGSFTSYLIEEWNSIVSSMVNRSHWFNQVDTPVPSNPGSVSDDSFGNINGRFMMDFDRVYEHMDVEAEVDKCWDHTTAEMENTKTDMKVNEVESDINNQFVLSSDDELDMIDEKETLYNENIGDDDFSNANDEINKSFSYDPDNSLTKLPLNDKIMHEHLSNMSYSPMKFDTFGESETNSEMNVKWLCEQFSKKENKSDSNTTTSDTKTIPNDLPNNFNLSLYDPSTAVIDKNVIMAETVMEDSLEKKVVQIKNANIVSVSSNMKALTIDEVSNGSLTDSNN